MATAIQVYEPDGTTEAWYYVLPACTRQTHQRGAEIPKHPVEQGVAVADHVRRLPRTLSLEGFVPRYGVQTIDETAAGLPSNAVSRVLADPSSALDLFQHNSDGRGHVKVWEQLERACEEGLLVTVFTGLSVYRNMALTSVTAPREVQTGYDLVFSLDAEEIVFGTAETAAVPKAAFGAPKEEKPQAARRGAGRTDRGRTGKPAAKPSVAALLG